MTKKLAKACAAVLAIVLCACYVVAVWRVNETAIQYPVERHAMGETVNLDGAFNETSDIEQTKDYALTVVGAHVMSVGSYLAQYGVKDATVTTDSPVSSVVVLDIRIDHRGSSHSGALLMADDVLVTPSGNEFYQFDPKLWAATEKKANPQQTYLSIRPGTSYVTHVPFVYGFSLGSGDDSAYWHEVTERSFDFEVSRIPICHVIEIHL